MKKSIIASVLMAALAAVAGNAVNPDAVELAPIPLPIEFTSDMDRPVPFDARTAVMLECADAAGLEWLNRHFSAIAVLLAAAVIFGLAWLWVRTPQAARNPAGDYAVYESARVVEILADTCEADPVADNAYRGEQTLTAQVLTGQFKGETLLCSNTCGPIYNQPVGVGDRVTLCISVYASGEHNATVY